MTYNFAILKNETDEDHLGWITAIKNSKEDIKYDIIDITQNNWLEKIEAKKYDIYLTRPPGLTTYFKSLYDERLYILNYILKKRIYPTYDEIFIYENKKLLSYWLKAKKIPHPKTDVFYHKKEALEFINNTSYPFVAKTAIGASGSGVKIIKTKKQALDYIQSAFSTKGIKRRWGPNKLKKNYLERLKKRLKDIPETIAYFKKKRHAAISDSQKWFVIFQEFINIKSEWRCVYIGGDYFGHKKEKRGELISGGGGIVWDYPSEKLLNFMKNIVDKGNLLGSSMDILELEDNTYLVNEVQSFFGFLHPDYQMLVKGNPGKFIYKDNRWQFVEGIFNKNNSFDLRLKHIISLLRNE